MVMVASAPFNAIRPDEGASELVYEYPKLALLTNGARAASRGDCPRVITAKKRVMVTVIGILFMSHLSESKPTVRLVGVSENQGASEKLP